MRHEASGDCRAIRLTPMTVVVRSTSKTVDSNSVHDRNVTSIALTADMMRHSDAGLFRLTLVGHSTAAIWRSREVAVICGAALIPREAIL